MSKKKLRPTSKQFNGCVATKREIDPTRCRAAINDMTVVSGADSEVCLKRQCRIPTKKSSHLCHHHKNVESRQHYKPNKEFGLQVQTLLQKMSGKNNSAEGSGEGISSYLDRISTDFNKKFLASVETNIAKLTVSQIQSIVDSADALLQVQVQQGATEVADYNRMIRELKKRQKTCEKKIYKVALQAERGRVDIQKDLAFVNESNSTLQQLVKVLTQERVVISERLVAYIHKTLSEFYELTEESSLLSKEIISSRMKTFDNKNKR